MQAQCLQLVQSGMGSKRWMEGTEAILCLITGKEMETESLGNAACGKKGSEFR